MSRTDRFVGCMVGLAVGDALGYPVEGWTAEQIEAATVGSGTMWNRRWIRRRSGGCPGLHSDDTQQALAVADVLIARAARIPTPCARSSSRWPKDLPISRSAPTAARDGISATRSRRSAEGAGWNQGSRHTAGVGASMRVAPVGLALGIDDAAVRNNTAHPGAGHAQRPTRRRRRLPRRQCRRTTGMDATVAVPAGAFLRESIYFVRRSEEWLIEAHGRHLARESRPLLHHMSEALTGIVDQIDKAARSGSSWDRRAGLGSRRLHDRASVPRFRPGRRRLRLLLLPPLPR